MCCRISFIGKINQVAPTLSRWQAFLRVFLIFLLVFVVAKLVFMAWYHSLLEACSLGEILAVLWHGLKLDASVAAYLTAIPGLILVASVWTEPKITSRLLKVYFRLISFIVSIILVVDLVLYGYWGFRLDSTPLFYLRQPKDAMASASWYEVVFGALAICLLTWLIARWLDKAVANRTMRRPASRVLSSSGLLFLTALLFLPIRGGVTVSTMNTGQVYFSQKNFLNHAAVNPAFSLFESLSNDQDFGSQYRYLPPQEADSLFAAMQDRAVQDCSSPISDSPKEALFNSRRPNVIVVILESFMSAVIEPLGGIPRVAPCLSRLGEEGILLTNFYGNSFRTDRGMVSILSGYPAQPTTSIMKFPRKVEQLPSFPKRMAENGYDLQYYYGGDANFTNMRSYLTSCGFSRIISDVDFPIKDRLSKWGALDGIVFERLGADLSQPLQEPFLKVLQTSSSHEPFDVPMKRFEDPYLNAVCYTDSCLWAFVEGFRQSPLWDSTVIVFVPDHAMRWPFDIENHVIERYRIPLILCGGAVKGPRRIDTWASQIDIAATLLTQLGMDHSDFAFSKDILDPASPHFAFYTCPNFFGYLNDEFSLIYNCDTDTRIAGQGEDLEKHTREGQAFLQKLYDDLGSR